MAEFKINRLRYTWRNVWTTATAYKRDDIIRVGSKTYVCTVGHTASSSFYTDLTASKWTQMSEGSTWRGNWAAATLYNLNDIIYYGGVAYICATSHTSSSLFDTDIVNWAEYVSGSEWNADWAPSTRYGIGDVVKYNGIVYRCVQGHTSSTTANGLEIGNNDAYQDSTGETWEVYNSGIEYRGDWDNDVRYRQNDLVKYGGTIWKCVTAHTSGDDSTLNFNSENFTVELRGEQFRGTWTDVAVYNIGDVVRYGGYLYVCVRNDVNENPSVETAAWTILTKNYNLRGDWSKTTTYKTGDVVRRGGQIFVASTDNTGVDETPTSLVVTITGPNSGDIGNKYNFDGNYLQVPDLQVGETYTFIQTDQTNLYFPNATGTTLNTHPLIFSNKPESVAHPTNDLYTEGITYYLDEIAVTQTEYIAGFATASTRKVSITVTSQTPLVLYYWCWNHRNMGSSINITSSTLGAEPSIGAGWTLLVGAEMWTGGWITDREYAVGDLVSFSSSTYRCIVSHRSLHGENFPTNGNGFDYWSLYLSGDDDNALANKGDLLTFGARADGSTLGTISVPIGTERELLTVQDTETSLGYEEHGQTFNFLYVSPTGIDAVGMGLTAGTPFKTIRYACEYAEENFTGNTNISVRTGHYYETLPIIVPAGTAVVGEEVRAVIVEPAPAVVNLNLDADYTKAVLGRIKDLIPDLIINTTVTATTGNTVEQNTSYNAGSSAASNSLVNLVDNIIDYIDFYISSTGTEPTLFGEVDETTVVGILNAISILEGNKEFLAAEAVAYMELNYPNYNFDGELCKRDIRRYIDAFKWDLTYSSNYKSILAARYYKNAVLGSKAEDMFYLRNGTGVRNMTLKGLEGELSPPIAYELYRRPGGGAFVSLDPGWGPDDERCWINSRSPYVQNCCTFGYGTIGQKIDGALHNGGNKSIVSNDFTQIISDGIGAWVLNGGRAELVSVFTYYSQIGYFAEDGGIIRATNGNNSYGDYGALADGNDPTETPRYGTINNRLNEAQVVDAFAGEVNDEILALEFSHCGQNYSTANYTFVGSGTGAVVYQEDFRDDAIFDAHIINPPDSGNAGGGGFTSFGNNAQSGNLTTITLSSNDNHSEDEVLGLRLTITSGTGTGQYGIITAFNEITKIATITRESDGQPGWDHILPGYPLVNPITTSAVYRVEPRPIFDHPGFSSAVVDLSVRTTWASVVYGETYASYTAVVAAAGTGVVDEELSPITATWNVIKNGRTYNVTLNNAGAGYALNQVITIIGSNVGGLDDENDIVITVTEISDDSTNSIVNFTYEGIAASGKFVAAPSTGTSGSASSDGETWSTIAFPTAGNWKCLASNNSIFVAIATNSSNAASSTNGVNWTARTMPASRAWNGVTYGSGIFVAVAGDSNAAAVSTNGTTWSSSTMPTFGDSTFNEWIDVTFGQNKFVAVANSGNAAAIGTYNSGTGILTWTGVLMDSVGDSSQQDWCSIAYGNNRFVAISTQGGVSYSFDGETWYGATMPTQDGSTAHYWKQIRHAQGVFFAVGTTGSRDISGDTTTGPTTFAATSYDGIVWTTRTLAKEANYTAIGFGNPDISLGDSTLSNSKGTWIALHDGPMDVLGTPTNESDEAVRIYTGARALGRCVITGSGLIDQIMLWDPGSGYTTEPTLTIVDPYNTTELFVQNRLGDGVLAQPSWNNRGSGYKTSSTTVTVTGDGFADIIPIDKYVSLDGLEILPGPGAQFRFGGRTDFYTVVTVNQESIDAYGNLTATFQISPSLTIADDLQHGTQVEIRERYSQIRITGHDFLDIGTGNFVETNYPELYATGNYLIQPENEIYESNGGRVFYTSTDQDGNFRTGELFAVEQATGIVTISADFFDLSGLTELALGGVRLGGSGTVIREFSTDPLFTADSNNIVPTQRAIKAYLQNRLSVGGSDLQIPSFIAGVVQVGPTSITTTTGVGIEAPKRMDFGGYGVRGTMIAQAMFHGSFNND